MATNFVRLEVILFIFCTLAAWHCSKAEPDDNLNYYKNGAGSREFVKRALNQAAKGVAAMQKLLSDAKYMKVQSERFRKYVKSGDVNTALSDFHSAQPIKVHRKSRFNFGKGGVGDSAIVGQVGDKHLILRPSGDKYSNRYPVLEIRTPSDPVYDRIVYMKPKQK